MKLVYGLLCSLALLAACGGSPESDPIAPDTTEAALCNCLDVWQPVCGEDGNTYGNACVAECAGVKVAYEGECRSCNCPDVWNPVCGEDGKTYGNECMANCAGVKVAYEGECKE